MKPKSMKRITVMMADDNREVRKAFRIILEAEADLEVVGEANNGKQAVTLVKKLRPDLVLMDVSMPMLNGLEATRQILKARPATQVLMLSAHSDEAYIIESLNAGAKGYLLKHSSIEMVCQAIRDVHQGKNVFSASIPKRLHKRSPA